MKGFSSKDTALKVDVIGPENMLFVGAFACIFQTGNFTGCGSEGVKQARLVSGVASLPFGALSVFETG